MSNNDDFDFNRDDLFDDFGDDDSSGDDFGSDDFDFGDDSDDFDFADDGDEFGSDLDSALGGDDDDFGGGDDDDDFATTESGQSGGGTSRTFILVAVLMVLFFLVGIGIVIFILLQPDQAQIEFEQTKAAIETQNAVSLTQIAASETAAIDLATATAEAESANATGTEQANLDATASFVPPSPTPTEDFTATALQGTTDALNAQATAEAQIAIDATNTEIAFQLTLNPDFATATQEVIPTETPAGESSEEPIPGGTVSISDVQLTATELSRIFQATPTASGGGEVATSVVEGTSVVIGGATEQPGQGGGGALPETGLFDDVFQGNPTFIFLAAFGLLGVIVFSRSVRGRKRDD